MMKISQIVFAGLILFSMSTASKNVFGAEYQYGLKIEPINQRFVAKPAFSAIETRIVVLNTGEDAMIEAEIKESTGKIKTSLLQLNDEQKWSEVEAPMLIRSNKSKTFTIVLSTKGDSIPEGEYIILTSFKMLPTYTPQTSSTFVQLKPAIKSNITLSVSKSGFTNTNLKVAHFTNLSGPVMMSDSSPQIVLLLQNLDKYSVNVDGMVTILLDGQPFETIKINPITIPANNQRYISNSQGEEGLLLPSKKLSPGKYEFKAQLSVNGSDESSVFASFNLWLAPHLFIYSLAATLIVMIAIIFIYQFIKE